MSDQRRKTTIEPMLSVRNGAKAVDFYTAAFGADTLFRLDGEDGGVVAHSLPAGRSSGLQTNRRST